MPGQSGPGSNGNEWVLHIPQKPSITGTSPSECLVSYPGNSLGGSYPSAELQSMYSTARADWAIFSLSLPFRFFNWNSLTVTAGDQIMSILLNKPKTFKAALLSLTMQMFRFYFEYLFALVSRKVSPVIEGCGLNQQCLIPETVAWAALFFLFCLTIRIKACT